jgi:tRNA (cytidine/uridine-2'-O-)-methyltransferase
MFHVVLVRPEIPQNTGNIIRLCANTGCTLHLIGPLGFELNDPKLRRAGLDYRDLTEVFEYPSFDEYLSRASPRRLFGYSTRFPRLYSEVRYESGDALVFGSETRGMAASMVSRIAESHRLTLPMLPSSRSLNLANSVAVVVYEAWRQLGFRSITSSPRWHA